MRETGERVVPLKALTSRCWISACNTMVGIVDPRHLLNLSMAGLTAVPDWTAAKYGLHPRFDRITGLALTQPRPGPDRLVRAGDAAAPT